MQLKKDMEEEMEVIRRRFKKMTEEEESTYEQQRQHLQDVYKRVVFNQSLAEEFRAKFIEHRGPSVSPSASASAPFRCMLPFFFPTCLLIFTIIVSCSLILCK